MKKSICSISTGPSTHLDHLAPLCEKLNTPLIVTEPDHLELSQKFYPMIETRYVPLQELDLEFLSQWDAIITCGKFWAMELQPALKLVQGADVRFIFSPHGHSDKEELLGSPIDQDIDLVYGPRMKAVRNNPDAVEIGNVRYAFYLKYQEHFDHLAAPFFQTDKKTILYAPTWQSKATPTSFFDKVDEVVALLSEKYHLLIKLHPLLEENNPALYHLAIAKHQVKATFIEDFPAIYPLLDKVAIYLGDHSSIGYDFLMYNRPLFFLSDNGALMECGKAFEGSVEDLQKDLSPVRKQCVADIFGTPPQKEMEFQKTIRCRLDHRQDHLRSHRG